MPLSAAARQARSERARKMHADGRLGAKAVQRRATERAAELRTQRAGQRASEMAQRFFEAHYDEWEKALLDGLRHGSPATRVRAAETVAKLALRGESLDATTAKTEHEQRSREELLAILSEKLTSGPSAPIIRAHLAAVESTADEIE